MHAVPSPVTITSSSAITRDSTSPKQYGLTPFSRAQYSGSTTGYLAFRSAHHATQVRCAGEGAGHAAASRPRITSPTSA
jgi:hypothetical protein